MLKSIQMALAWLNSQRLKKSKKAENKKSLKKIDASKEIEPSKEKKKTSGLISKVKSTASHSKERIKGALAII